MAKRNYLFSLSFVVCFNKAGKTWLISRKLGAFGVDNGAVAIGVAVVNVEGCITRHFAVKPVCIVLIRWLAFQLESGPWATVADAGRDETTVLFTLIRSSAEGRQFLEEGHTVCNNASLVTSHNNNARRRKQRSQ